MQSAVVNLKHQPHAVRNGAVRIDRRTKWGNPYGEQTVMESGNGFSS